MPSSRHTKDKDAEKREKKVHYSASTKSSSPTMPSHHHNHSSSHRPQRSNDSGVGSSLASDRATMGTTSHPTTQALSAAEIEEQSHNPQAVREALRAANAHLRSLERKLHTLTDQLNEAQQKSRVLWQANDDLSKDNSKLERECESLRARLQALSSGATSASQSTGSSASRNKDKAEHHSPISSSSTRQSRRASISNAPTRRSTSHVRTSDGDRDRRASRAYNIQPSAEPRPNNPFAPQSPMASTPRTVPVMQPPASVAYSQAPIAYSSAPLYPQAAGPQTGDPFPNDGLYHPYPL